MIMRSKVLLTLAMISAACLSARAQSTAPTDSSSTSAATPAAQTTTPATPPASTDSNSTPAAQTPAPITSAQAAAWRIASENVANFLAGAAGQIRAIVPDQQLAGELGAVVDDSRKRATQAAAQPPSNRDPLPLLRDDWDRLRTIVKRAAYQNLAGGHTLELLSFVTVGDALFAIDSESPALGSCLSSAALDELSRTLGSPAAARSD